MNVIGQVLLFTSWALGLSGFLLGAYAGYKKQYQFNSSLRLITLSVGIFSVLSLFILAYLFLTDDYTNQYVWQHSNKGMPNVYKVTAIWGGMDGSMLLWASLITFFSSIVAICASRYSPQIIPYLCCVMNSRTDSM